MSLSTEIGGEFWQDDDLLLPQPRVEEVTLGYGEQRTALSGRTALNMIVEDLLAQFGHFSVCLPLYSCHSMIKPFLRQGVETCFYKVFFNQKLCYDFKNAEKCDVVYLLDYFGFGDPQVLHFAERCKSSGHVVIYDRTQMLFSQNQGMMLLADYEFASYRKWFYTNYAVAKKNKGNFLVPPCEKPHFLYLEMRNEAMKLKMDFIKNGSGKKEHYLSLYRKAEDLLDNDSVGYSAEEKSAEMISRIDFSKIICKRRKNAMILMEHIREMPRRLVSLFFDALKEEDCPLFVSVNVHPGARDHLCQELIQNSVYCPRHWPLSDLHPSEAEEGLYSQELSIVCDQRYSDDDMKRVADIMQNWCERYA